MAAQTRRVLVPRLDDRFEEPFIDVAILEGFQKLGYDRPTQEQAQAVRSFVLGSDVFVMLPTGSGKSLCYASLPYIFDSLRQSAGEKDAHHCIAVVVNVSNCPRAIRRWWVKQPSKGALNGLAQTTQTAAILDRTAVKAGFVYAL